MPDDQPGLAVGVITDRDDPEKLARVRLSLPWLNDSFQTDWVRLSAPYGSRRSSPPTLPEVGSEVLVGFLHGDIRHPVVLGQLINSAD